MVSVSFQCLIFIISLPSFQISKNASVGLQSGATSTFHNYFYDFSDIFREEIVKRNLQNLAIQSPNKPEPSHVLEVCGVSVQNFYPSIISFLNTTLLQKM